MAEEIEQNNREEISKQTKKLVYDQMYEGYVWGINLNNRNLVIQERTPGNNIHHFISIQQLSHSGSINSIIKNNDYLKYMEKSCSLVSLIYAENNHPCNLAPIDLGLHNVIHTYSVRSYNEKYMELANAISCLLFAETIIRNNVIQEIALARNLLKGINNYKYILNLVNKNISQYPKTIQQRIADVIDLEK